MSGDPTNAAVWAGADVYIGALDAVDPVDGAAFGADWDNVGLLNGDDGFTEKADMDSSDFYAWGGILVATTRKNFKLTRSFTAYEDNATVFDLWYPGHDVTFDGEGGYSGTVNVPDLSAKFKIAFETRTGSQIKRVISKNYAQVDARGDFKEGESDLASRALTVAIYPAAADEDGKAALFSTYRGAASAAKPSIASVLPASAGEGDLVTIEGGHFTGATAVSFGGTAATAFDVVDSRHIVAELPAGTAGSAAVVVTNAAGASASFAYTRT